ncbi:MAG: PAS domain S-box protein [Cytobacillus gottheilii]|uniref:PAS domain S-box protein n=1 Tax=Cytobacillus gottheilii TaxID=859144 RepID=UPI00346497D9
MLKGDPELDFTEGVSCNEVLDLFLASSADGIAIFDMQDCFRRINPTFTYIFGYTEEEVLGRNIAEMPNPVSVIDIIREVKTGKVYSNLNTIRYHKDGRQLDIAVSYSPFRDSDGRVMGIIAVLRDITELKEMERDLIQIKKLYNLITENTTDMIKIYTKDYEVLYASPSHHTELGVSPETLKGQKLETLIQPINDEPVDELLQRIAKNGKSEIIQAKTRTKQNEFMHIESNISPIYNEANEIDLFLKISRNIDDRIKNDEVLRNLDRLSIIGQTAASVAHEIKNPLTALKGFSKLLQYSDEKERQAEYLTIIMDELKNIDKSVNEFLALAKPQAVELKSSSLFSIINSSIKMLRSDTYIHNVKIIHSIKEDQYFLKCNPDQLQQAFMNFFKNAIEAMSDGGLIHCCISEAEEDMVEVQISDSGMGIEPEILHYLGTPFYTTKNKGIGLGLTVSNKIIQEHNGTMQIDSTPGHGTIVTVQLPKFTQQ